MYSNYYQTPSNYTNSQIPSYNSNMNQNKDERLIGGGFLGPFVLGGITGGLLAPSFYPQRPPYGPGFGPGFGPGPRPYPPNYYYYGGYYR